jgi:hypothetical protein
VRSTVRGNSVIESGVIPMNSCFDQEVIMEAEEEEDEDE